MKKSELPERVLELNEALRRNPRMTEGMGPVCLLSVPGRTSGKLRATPVSPLSYAGKRWLVAGFDDADWVKNLRASGWGILTKGENSERIAASEVPVAERAPILQAFLQHTPGGRFACDIEPDAPTEAFAAVVEHYPIFQITKTKAASSIEDAAAMM